ncbi:MAG: hypothetical protein JNK04_21180 [Myxococcales bacterium]|nr:hypothetical protein [Myxococcales bacterium]
MKGAVALLLPLFLVGCSDDGTGTGGEAPQGCLSCDSPKTLAAPKNAEVAEVSGLVASATHAGIFYVHNDAGDEARFFALAEDGADHGTFVLEGRSAVDIEDASGGPCADPATPCLFLADIGDNDEARSSYVIYRVEEPSSVAAGVYSVSADALPFRYPDGSHDAEAMFVDPKSGAIVVVTKKAGTAYVYRPPLRVDQTVELERLGSVALPDQSAVTGASIGAKGEGILLRTKNDVWHFAIGDGSFEDALEKKPCSLPSPGEANAEAVAWSADGTGYRTMGEGAGARLVAVSCEQ